MMQSVSGRLEADRQALEAADEDRFDPRRLAREFDRLQPRQQLFHQDSHLHPREMLPQAHMRAKAEGDLLILKPAGSKAVGRGEKSLVRVRRDIVTNKPTPLRIALPADPASSLRADQKFRTRTPERAWGGEGGVKT